MKKDFFALSGRNSAKKILEFVDENEHVLYKDLLQFSPPSSLRKIVKDILNHGLITCFCSQKTTELKLTERGRLVLEGLRGTCRALEI